MCILSLALHETLWLESGHLKARDKMAEKLGATGMQVQYNFVTLCVKSDI